MESTSRYSARSILAQFRLISSLFDPFASVDENELSVKPESPTDGYSILGILRMTLEYVGCTSKIKAVLVLVLDTC